MSKQQMIDAIRQHNRTADEDFLASFDEQSLQRYLKRLTDIHGRRGKSSVWVREARTPAIVSRP